MLQEIWIDNKLVFYVYVPESSEVHKLNNSIIYERTDEGDKDITANQYAVKRMYLRKSGQKTEYFVYPSISFNDFDTNTIKKARKLISVRDKINNWDNLSDEEILKNSRFYKKNFITGEIGFTLSSILLFGKKDVIPGILSWYKVDALKKIKDIERYDDRFICEVNLISDIDSVKEYSDSQTKILKYIDLNGSINNEQCRNLLGIERPKSSESSTKR